MAGDKKSRFVIVDGVQVARARAVRLGLIKDDEPRAAGPSQSRARGPETVRKGNPPKKDK